MFKNVQGEQKKHKGFERFSLKIPIENYHFLRFFFWVKFQLGHAAHDEMAN